MGVKVANVEFTFSFVLTNKTQILHVTWIIPKTSYRAGTLIHHTQAQIQCDSFLFQVKRCIATFVTPTSHGMNAIAKASRSTVETTFHMYVIKLSGWKWKMIRKFIIIIKAADHSSFALDRSARTMVSRAKYIVVIQMLVMSRGFFMWIT